MGLMAQWAVHVVSDEELNGSNPDVVEYFSTRLPFESNSTLVGLCFKIQNLFGL